LSSSIRVARGDSFLIFKRYFCCYPTGAASTKEARAVSSPSFFPLFLALLDHDGDTLAAANARRSDSELLVLLLLHHVGQVAHDTGAGGTERVAQSDGTTVGVELGAASK
jgi:hypothetical protein